MRKQRDGEDTRQRVLAAAQMLFAQKGFSGTSLADISQGCGISDGLILHHFHSKKNLYRQVQENLAEQYTRVLVQAREETTSPLEMIQHTLTATFNFWKQDSTYQRISLWAYLEGQSEFPEKEAQLTAGLAQVVKQLQEQGFLDDRFSPIVQLTMIIGPIHFWMRYRDRFRQTLHMDKSLEDLDQLFLGQLIHLITEMTSKA